METPRTISPFIVWRPSSLPESRQRATVRDHRENNLEKLAFAEGERAASLEITQMTEDEVALRDTVRTLLRREIVEPTEDSDHITVPLIAYYVRSQRQPF